MEKGGEKEHQDGAKSMPEEQTRECGSARRGTLLALQAMTEVWEADDDTIAKLISKGRQLAPEDRAFILGNLKEYYERADTATRMLTRGMPEEQILDVLQINDEQLDKLKRYLKNKN